MSGARPASVIDPVCGMFVDVARAEEDGLTLEHAGRTYAFCRAGCRRAFLEDPATYAAQADAADVAVSAAAPGGAAIIDEGMRRWYESCSCCLSETYPEIKAQLDAERAAAAAEPVGAGNCEVAEAEVAVPAT